VYAWKSSGGPKDSTDNNAAISQHDSESPFSWDYTGAKGGNSVNPLVNTVPAGSGTATGAATATVSCVPRPTSAGSAVTSGAASASQAATSTRSDDDENDDNTQRGRPTTIPSSILSRFGPQRTDTAEKIKRQEINYCDDSSSSNTNTGFIPLSGTQSTMSKRLAAHGILAALAFVILFPAGAIAVRLASFRLVVWFHAGFQMFAYVVYIAAFGLGVTMANDLKVVSSLLCSHLPAISTNSSPAKLPPPHHRHSRLRRPLHPTLPRLPPSLYVQEIPNTHRCLARPYLVW
jgi:hypothetical protein